MVKADGLAAGKGVIVCDDLRQALELLPSFLARRSRRPAPRLVVVEERLAGREASVIALCDGERRSPCPRPATTSASATATAARTPAGWAPTRRCPTCPTTLVDEVLATVHRPILAELARRGTPFRGALYAGLMLTDDGPVLLECNARLGDPETQAILPRLAGALGPLLLAAARGGAAGRRPGRRLPTLPGRDRRDRARRRGLPGHAAARRPDRRPRGGRGRPARSSSTPAPSRDRAAATARTAAGCSPSSAAVRDLAAPGPSPTAAADAIAWRRDSSAGATSRRAAGAVATRGRGPR